MSRMTRWKAAASHLAISVAIGGVVLALMLLVWYPEPYFTAAGGNRLVMILVAVDVILGPLATLVVFTPTKPRRLIVLDLAVIGAFQVAALAYGAHVMAEVRPLYMVFTV